MDKHLMAVLERIAVACEEIAAATSRKPSDFEAEHEARHRRHERFRLQIETDKRFPGLAGRMAAFSTPLSNTVRERVMQAADPAALINHFVTDVALVRRLNTLEPDELETEINRLAQRLSIKAV